MAFDLKLCLFNSEKDDGLNQQIQSKIERINLKDFGFEGGVRINRKHIKNEPKVSVESRFSLPNEDRILTTNRGYSRRPTDTRLYSRRDLRMDSNKSSPLEWTSSSSVIGLSNDRAANSRRAYNLSSEQTSNRTSIHTSFRKVCTKTTMLC